MTCSIGSPRLDPPTGRPHIRRTAKATVRRAVEALEGRRLFTSAALDPSFAGDGIAILDNHPTYLDDSVVALAVDAADRTVVIEAGGHRLRRYTAAGTVDPTFATIDLGPRVSADDLVFQSNGQLIVALSDFDGRRTELRRFTSSGAIDPTFAFDAFLEPGGRNVLAIDASDRPILASRDYSNVTTIIRFTANGAQGRTAIAPMWGSNLASVSDIVVDSAGDIVLLNNAPPDFLSADGVVYVSRLTATGDFFQFDGPFGDNFTATKIISNSGYGSALLATPDHGYIVAGRESGTGAIWSLTSAGQLSTTFGEFGVVHAQANDSVEPMSFNGITRINDQYVVAGTAGVNYDRELLIGVYDIAGHADANFDQDGLRRDELFADGFPDTAALIASDSQRRLLIGGTTMTFRSDGNLPQEDGLLARYTFAGPAPFVATVSAIVFNDADGDGIRDTGEAGIAGQTLTLDPTIDGNISDAIDAVTDGNGVARWTLRQPSQVQVYMTTSIAGRKPTAAGNAYINVIESGQDYQGGSFGFRSLPANTQLDSSFATNGVRSLNLSLNAARATDNGFFYLLSSFGQIERRLVNTGDLDASFGASGVITAFGSGSGLLSDVLPLPDGRFIAASSTGDLLVRRFLANGQLDTTFGVNGTRQLDFGANEFLPTLALGANGTILIASARQSAAQGFTNTVAVARLTAAGALDNSFDGDGMKLIAPPGLPNGFYYRDGTMISQPDGKMLFVAQQDAGPFGDVIVRLNSDGSFDSSFGGGDGVYSLPGATSGYVSVGAIKLDSVGRLLYTGRVSLSGGGSMIAGRLTTAGAVDSTFGSAGARVVTFTRDLGGTTPVASGGTAIAIMSNGQIVLAGGAYTTGNVNDTVVARLLPDGAIDASFGRSGLARMAIANGDEVARAVAVGSDGRPVVAASARVNGPSLTYLARFTAPALGSIAGTLFNDINGNGVKDTSEVGFAGRTIYIDADNDGTLDPGERSTTTDPAGAYRLDGMIAGTYAIRQVTPPRWTQTTPAAGAASITLTAGQNVTGVNFGTRNTGGPAVVSSAFDFETGLRFSMQWEENVAATYTVNDTTIVNTITGAPLPSSFWSLAVSGASATITLANNTPNGSYEVRIRVGGVSSSSGVSNPSTITLPSFFVLAGDIDRNRKVEFNDLVILAQNYGKSGKTFSQGNVNYSADGKVDFDDLVLLAQKFNVALSQLGVVVSTTPSAPSVLDSRKRNLRPLEI